MTPEEQERRRIEDEAVLDFGRRAVQAWMCFDAPDLPQWKRTVNGLDCFKDLRLDTLHTQLRRRVERAFSRMNAICATYPIQTWDDYQLISAADLDRIQKLIRNI